MFSGGFRRGIFIHLSLSSSFPGGGGGGRGGGGVLGGGGGGGGCLFLEISIGIILMKQLK